MNAKKIMGAVLVAFLAAALFIGAGAAADTLYDGDTVFVYQEVNGLSGEWTNGVNTITAISKNGVGYFSGENIVEGKYTQGSGDNEITLYVKYPAVTISGVANTGDAAYLFIGGNFYTGATQVSVTDNCPANTTTLTYNLYLTYPNGKEVNVSTLANGIQGVLLDDPAVGEYSIRAKYATTGFAVGTPVTALITKPVTFNVVGADDATITASVDQILKGKEFKVTITGEPGVNYKVVYDKDAFTTPTSIYSFTAVDQIDGDSEYFTFEMPNSGSIELSIAGDANVAEKTEKLTLYKEVVNADSSSEWKKVEAITITFTKGTISAKADAASYFVGDVITISGTNTAGPIVGYTIKGTNFEYSFGEINTEVIDYEEGNPTSETFEFEIATADIKNEKFGLETKKLDVGTYTLTIFVGNMGLNNQEPTAKATVALVLKQPFISIIEAPEVIVQDTDVEFVINAEATEKIAYYIFGTNYFTFKKDITADEDVENQFTIELGKGITKNMSAGQYFMVIQHPMYDEVFNIMANDYAFYLNTTGAATGAGDDSKLFSFDIRQTANAAQALCDNLDSQTIDDMYVKYSFFVVGEDESFTISDIPTTIAQGDTLTISGVSTSNAEEYVTVEMISTAFAAVPKETVGSASFIAVTTQIAEDGTWEVTFDTSNLNVDEYSLKVACGEDTWKNVEINVVEAADEPVTPPTDEPGQDEPGQDEPVAPETPGFGALAALAGLGAVAVLLLRRE